jgi:O-antigen ligase
MYNLPAVIGGLALLRHRNWRLLGSALVILGVTGTIVSASRASILAAFSAVLALTVLAMQRANLRRSLITLSVVVVITMLGVVSYDVYLKSMPAPIQRVTKRRFSQNGTLNDPRRALQRLYVEEASKKPLFGDGPGYIKRRAEAGLLVPHNSFLDVAVELGLPALVLYLIAMLRPLATFRSARESERGSYLYCCFTGMLIPLFTLSSAFLPLVWATACAVVGASRHYNSPSQRVANFSLQTRKRMHGRGQSCLSGGQ